MQQNLLGIHVSTLQATDTKYILLNFLHSFLKKYILF